MHDWANPDPAQKLIAKTARRHNTQYQNISLPPLQTATRRFPRNDNNNNNDMTSTSEIERLMMQRPVPLSSLERLRGLLQGNPNNNANGIKQTKQHMDTFIRIGGPTAILSVLKKSKYSRKDPDHATASLKLVHMSSFHETSCAAIVDATGVTTILAAMKKIDKHSEFQQLAIGTLMNLACHYYKDELAEAIRPVVACMSRFPLDLMVQRSSCGFLRNMSGQCGATIVKAGAMPKILSALERFHKEDGKLVEWASNAVEALARTDNGRAALRRKKASYYPVNYSTQFSYILLKIFLHVPMDRYTHEAVSDAYLAVTGKPIIDWSPLFQG